jgi:hypothetical protein
VDYDSWQFNIVEKYRLCIANVVYAHKGIKDERSVATMHHRSAKAGFQKELATSN